MIHIEIELIKRRIFNGY